MEPDPTPHPPTQPLTGPVRRTTIVVRDCEASLRFYRDLLGWDVFFDREWDTQTGAVLGHPAPRIRMVVLRATDQELGMVGLLQYIGSPQVMQEAPGDGIYPGRAYLVITSLEYPALMGRLRAAGVRFVHDEIQNENGIREVAVFDPDGVMVNIIGRPPDGGSMGGR